jgi:hypothetical protein
MVGGERSVVISSASSLSLAPLPVLKDRTIGKKYRNVY